MSSREEERKKSFKGGVDAAEARRRRNEATIQHPKGRRGKIIGQRRALPGSTKVDTDVEAGLAKRAANMAVQGILATDFDIQ